jgi:hypothetical protein
MGNHTMRVVGKLGEHKEARRHNYKRAFGGERKQGLKR